MTDLLNDQKDCKVVEVGQALPSLIRDLHTTLGAGHDVAVVLRLLALAHVQGTQAWLMDVGANLISPGRLLRWQRVPPNRWTIR
ncbi:hypothetical protein [Lentzea flava]|uniref:Uncharacterized protein n=1 Tax=Lentzea flava TaxID=103732 RepID=A0ABQ2VAK4_9PSEU|nr:hypothetical protein [Lentzea flava]MCP2203789.1 hypothetical protein [Lentzea flava]GGU71767.1 hypothetical protein GCM10010178_74240 [Lentzea flava]